MNKYKTNKQTKSLLSYASLWLNFTVCIVSSNLLLPRKLRKNASFSGYLCTVHSITPLLKYDSTMESNFQTFSNHPVVHCQ